MGRVLRSRRSIRRSRRSAVQAARSFLVGSLAARGPAMTLNHDPIGATPSLEPPPHLATGNVVELTTTLSLRHAGVRQCRLHAEICGPDAAPLVVVMGGISADA